MDASLSFMSAGWCCINETGNEIAEKNEACLYKSNIYSVWFNQSRITVLTVLLQERFHWKARISRDVLISFEQDLV